MMDVSGWIHIIITALITACVGGVIGGLVAWGGIRIRLEHIESKLLSISKTVVYKDVCEQCRKNVEDRQASVKQDIEEIKKDVKELLKRKIDLGE